MWLSLSVVFTAHRKGLLKTFRQGITLVIDNTTGLELTHNAHQHAR